MFGYVFELMSRAERRDFEFLALLSGDGSSRMLFEMSGADEWWANRAWFSGTDELAVFTASFAPAVAFAALVPLSLDVEVDGVRAIFECVGKWVAVRGSIRNTKPFWNNYGGQIMICGIVALLLGAGIAIVAYRSHSQSRMKYVDPPVARISFWKCAYVNLVSGLPFNLRRLALCDELSKEDIKIHEEWFGFFRILTLSTPEAVRTQFDHKRFPKLDFNASGVPGFKHTFSYYLFGTNIVGTVGDEYILHRSITRPAFARPFRVPVFVSCVNKLLAILYTHGHHHPDSPLEAYTFMQRLTLDVLGAAMLSFNFGSLVPDSKVTNANGLKPGRYVDIWNELASTVLRPINFLVPYYSKLPIERNRRAWKAAREFREMMEKIVDDRTAERHAAGLHHEKNDLDLVDLMVEAAEEKNLGTDGAQWTRKQTVDNLAVFFVAGHDTTANALSAAFYLLAAHPSAQDAMQEELFRVFDLQFENSDISNFGHLLGQCTYVIAVIKEAMRLYPSAAVTGLRVASEDIDIRVPMPDGSVRNYTIKRGAIVRANIMDMHYDPDVFANPTAFMPERWLKKGNTATFGDEGSDGTSSSLSGWMPFGGGLRMCMGIQMSLLEQRVTLAMVMRGFRVELSDETRKNGYVLGTANLLRPVGVKLFFRPLIS
ncbi:cytochrome P450 [Cladochytrium replicatum]|nr:cytochrome P450 [Cladochytrium replicatum]